MDAAALCLGHRTGPTALSVSPAARFMWTGLCMHHKQQTFHKLFQEQEIRREQVNLAHVYGRDTVTYFVHWKC